MASSLNQPKSESGLTGGSAFGFSWRSPHSAGPETVITSARTPLPPTGPDAPSYAGELVPRLFPGNQDSESAAGISIGHFTIQKRIGVGGMGSVFLALDERLKRDVALKVLSPTLSLDQTSIQRFQNEAQAAARLDHDNIARVFYSGEEFGLHYIAYEYVPGQNLRDVIRGKGWLEPAEAVNYAIQLTAALHHSSSAGVIHRDIKPSNVLITPFGRAKLVDLGLARKTSIEASSAELTVPGTTMGTFDYISPEQARDPHSVDVRSDIYSLGCTLYHMLTGEPPYPEGTVLQKLLDHHAKDAPDPAKKNRRVSPMLSHVVRKMMASQPAHRYAIPADLLRDLLLVARSLGAGAVPIDGQVWLTASRFKPPFWQSNFGWVATTCALCLMVSAAQLYPGRMERLIQRNSSPAMVDNRPNTSTTGQSVAAVSGAPEQTKSEQKTASKSTDPMTSVVGQSPIFNMNGEKPAVPEPVLVGPVAPAPDLPTTDDKGILATMDAAAPIQVVNGKSYPTLEAACAEASDSGSITMIELRYNGQREPERPIRLANKKVVIRAAKGFRPTIRFAVSDVTGDSGHTDMIAVTGGSLDLFDVDLMMTVPNRVGSDRWSLFSLERPEKVQLEGVTLTIVNPFNKPACVFEQRSAIGGLDGIGNRNDGMPVVPPELLLTQCLARGNGDLIVMRDPVPARFELKETAVGIDGSLLSLKLMMDSVGMDRESITLELEHFTFRYGESLIAVEGTGSSTERLPPIMVYARNNVLSCAPNKPLISIRGVPDFMDFRSSFSWRGNLNFYDNMETFLEISSPNRNNLDHAAWKALTNEGFGSSNLPVVWRTKWLERPYASLTPENLELSANAQPAMNGASDGNAAGAPIKRLQERLQVSPER